MNGGAVPVTKTKIYKALIGAFFLLSLAGCGGQISFEKVDYKGHVRVEEEGVGYCFKIPEDWEIRLKLEGADVVCMAPITGGFRESVVATSIPGSQLTDPSEVMKKQLEVLGSSLKIVEPWTEPGKPVVVTLNKSEFSKEPLGQMLFLHIRKDGSGVLITCTTTESALQERRAFFTGVVDSAKYKVEDCTGPGGLPKVFPTPEVTFSPAPG